MSADYYLVCYKCNKFICFKNSSTYDSMKDGTLIFKMIDFLNGNHGAEKFCDFKKLEFELYDIGGVMDNMEDFMAIKINIRG